MLSMNSNVVTLLCHNSDPSIMHPSTNVATSTTIDDVATFVTRCRDIYMMSRHSSANVMTLDF